MKLVNRLIVKNESGNAALKTPSILLYPNVINFCSLCRADSTLLYLHTCRTNIQLL